MVAEILPGAAGIVAGGEQVTGETPSLTANRGIEKMVDADADKCDRGDAVQNAAHALAHYQHRGEPGSRKLESKAGDDQHEETREQSRVLPAESQRHPRNQTRPLELAAGYGLRSPDDDVVQEHSANDGEDHAQVEAADPADGFAADIRGERSIQVNFGRGEFAGCAGVALAASSSQVGAMDRGARVARRENAVRAVAAGTICDNLRPEARS